VGTAILFVACFCSSGFFNLLYMQLCHTLAVYGVSDE
jgi:hypothetical protein